MHKNNCQCASCKAKRGEYVGKNNPNFGNSEKQRLIWANRTEEERAIINEKISKKTKGRLPSFGMKGKHHSEKTKQKLRGYKVPRETRICTCGKSFICKINSTRKYCSFECSSNYIVQKGRFLPNLVPWNKGLTKETDIRIKHIADKVSISRGKQATRKMNKSECLLNRILIRLFERNYKYVGNFKVIIESKSPDFININGQKKIIELFGDYWHGENRRKEFGDLTSNEEHEQKRKDLFAKYGYKTLIIWQHELKNIKKLEDKLIKFNSI